MTDLSTVIGGVSEFRFDTPLEVDAIPEFHAARILLLLRICGSGTSGLMHGRTKLAKLDFFVRYPHFLEVALTRMRDEGLSPPNYQADSEGVEASMVRYRFGPWDHRYYDFLALLFGKGLIKIGGSSRVETYSLTDLGKEVVEALRDDPAFASVVHRCEIVEQSLAHMSGTEIKNFVYDTFVNEVAELSLGAVIS